MKKIFTVSLLFIVSIIYSGYSRSQVANDSRVLLQGFYWDCNVGNEWYNIINNHAQEIADAGYDMIWLPPPSKGSSGMGYLPTELNDLSNNFGSYDEHLTMITTLNNLGVEPIADIVINHRAGSTNWLDFTNPTWGTSSITSNDEVWSESDYSGITDRGSYDTGENYEAARDIDHSQQWVRTEIITWLTMLKDFGYKGWRYDLVKGYDPAYIEEYNDATSPTFSVGEYYDSDKQNVQDWIDGTSFASTAFDFPTYSTVKAAIKDNNYSYLAYEGAPSGLISWSPANSTTFIENHDTPRYDSDNDVLTSDNVGMAYAYLLTHPGVPTVYWPHWYDWGVEEEINTLIQVRKDNGIHSQSIVSIQQATTDVYAAIIDDKVAVKIGSGSWSPEDTEYTLVASGNNYAIWSKSSETVVNDDTLTLMWQTSNSTPYIYYWNVDGSTNNPVAWPGTLMTESETFPGWYECTINATSANVIFNDGNGTQTDDLLGISDSDCNTADKTVWWDDSQWIDNNCTTYTTISFDANGGTGSMSDITVESGTTTTITANAYSMDGYLFTGWCNTADGSGDWYQDEEEITTETEALTLYAQWSITTQINKISQHYNFYPNPAKDYIQLDGITNCRIILFNINGTVILDQIATTNQLDISHLPNGIYILSMNNNLQKLTIQK